MLIVFLIQKLQITDSKRYIAKRLSEIWNLFPTFPKAINHMVDCVNGYLLFNYQTKIREDVHLIN